MSSPRIRKAIYWALIGAMLLTLAFIFSNSLRAPDESMEQSSAVGGFFAVIFPPDKPFGGFVQEYIRKIGHFAEYAVLGGEAAIFVMFYLQSARIKLILSIPIGMCVAVVDETLQYFSGRGPAISDLWIDFGGFLTGLGVGVGVAAFIAHIIKRHYIKSAETEESYG